MREIAHQPISAFLRYLIPINSCVVKRSGRMLANTIDTFADQCLRLIKSPQLRESLSSAALDLLQRRYRPGLLDSQVLDLTD